MSRSYRLVWAPIALRDLEEILDYVAEHGSLDSAERIGNDLLERVERLRAHPSLCRVVPELLVVGVREYRELIVRPYRVFFRVTGRDIEIIGVLDGRRDLEELLLARALEP